MSITYKELIKQYKLLHKKKKYGSSSVQFINLIGIIIDELKPKYILDFGCGQSDLHKIIYESFGIFCDRYDPAIEGIDIIKRKNYDFIICTDVLEHIPESDIKDVLSFLKKLSNKVFFNIATREAVEILPNGQNAHCTVKKPVWWFYHIRKHFSDLTMICHDPSYSCSIFTWYSVNKYIYDDMIAGIMYKERFNKNNIKFDESDFILVKIHEEINKYNKIAIFGLGKSGKMTYEFIKKYYPEKIKYFIDDNVKGEYDGIPIVTTDEFLKKYQEKVDAVVFGKYQHLNPKLLPNLKIKYLKMENIV